MNKRSPRLKRNIVLTQAKTKAKIRVRLNANTIITIPSMSAFKVWKEKYPDAQVIIDAA